MDEKEILENQIGKMGADTNQEQPQNLGKLTHYNSEHTLSDEEEASKEQFLNKSRKLHTADDDGRTIDIMDGWIPINREEMGIRSQFYPESWQFRIRPATVDAIKNWSSIDEESLTVSNMVFNEIMKACVSIQTPTGKLPWSKVNSWDRFWFILMVHKYTFMKGEAAIRYDDECPECGTNITYELNPESLVYEFPDEDIVEKHWSADDRTWYINPKEYGLDGPMIKLYVPTLEKDDAILQWAYTQQQLGKKINSTFLRVLPWMLPKAPKDEQAFEKIVKDCKATYQSWNEKMFSFVDDVIRNIIINPSEKLKQICPNCGEEVISTVRFPNGIKHLFSVQGGYKKFGSK